MKRRVSMWLGIAGAVALWAVGGLRADEPTPLQTAEEAAKKAVASEEVMQNEWNSREMARSATREIARVERSRSESAVADYRRAIEGVTAAEAAAKAARAAADGEPDAAKKTPLVETANQADAAVAAAKANLEQRLAAMHAALDRLIEDSVAGERAANELLVSENGLRDKMAESRAVELKVLEMKAASADAASVDAAKRAIFEMQAVQLWERQLWAGVQQGTLGQIIEMTDHAGRIAADAATIEPDAARKKTLEEFAQRETKGKTDAEKTNGECAAIVAKAISEIYPLRAAAMGGLTPLAPEKWDLAKARHLLVRAGFGGTPQEVKNLHAMGLYAAVDHLVDFHRQAPAPASLDVIPVPLPDPLEGKLRNAFVRGQAAGARNSIDGGQFGALRQWWIKRMVASPRPLQEKLTLFWHGHFATQQSVVQNTYILYHQNQLFREHAAGNFGGLLYGIVHDPVMIRYLDNNLNVVGHPNENLAREIMELFAMGVDQGYTEHDIREAARALTGYTYDNATGQFRYVLKSHDPGDKTIFGKTGPWTGDDLVNLLLEQPSTARFISFKLYEYFVKKDPAPEVVDKMATVLRTNQYELNPMLKNLFLSEEFYSDAAMGTQIKSPVQLVVGMLRDLGAKEATNFGQIDGMIQEMGQQLFEPPDVKGWRYGRSWISSNRVFSRYNAAATLANSVPLASGASGVDLVGLLATEECKTAEDVIQCLAKVCLAKPLNDEQRAKLVAYLGQLPPQAEWAGQKDAINAKLRNVLVLLLCTPEYQVT
ncbi:MAG: DUF1800 domain-containing protein [Planctomycetes bacterium]|nr:DUF1800 domain-containing protein [Planctomycetota bacterium]